MIRVVVGELGKEAVDAVLRPADATLAPVGAAAVRLDELGGEDFAKERRTATPLEAGAAVVTGAGALAAGFVLHVVVADERGAAGREQVRRALVSAWQRAGDWGLARVAAPLVGRRMQAIIRIEVVLPAPLGPSRPNSSPRGTSRSMPSTAVNLP